MDAGSAHAATWPSFLPFSSHARLQTLIQLLFLANYCRPLRTASHDAYQKGVFFLEPVAGSGSLSFKLKTRIPHKNCSLITYVNSGFRMSSEASQWFQKKV